MYRKPTRFKPRFAKQLKTDGDRQSSARRGYNREWREKIRPEVLGRDGYKCQSCGANLMGKKQAHVDHIVPLARGGTNDIDNLQTLCASCHSTKTVKEDGGFGHG